LAHKIRKRNEVISLNKALVPKTKEPLQEEGTNILFNQQDFLPHDRDQINFEEQPKSPQNNSSQASFEEEKPIKKQKLEHGSKLLEKEKDKTEESKMDVEIKAQAERLLTRSMKKKTEENKGFGQLIKKALGLEKYLQQNE